MSDEKGGQRVCHGCGEEVEDDWVKCPMCKADLAKAPSKEEPAEEMPKAPPPRSIPPLPPPPGSRPSAVPPGPPAKDEGATEAPEPVGEDLKKAEEARRISETAVARSKADAEKDKLITGLKAELEEKDRRISKLEEEVVVERGKRAEKADMDDEMRQREEAVSEMEVEMGQRVAEVDKREADVKKAEADLEAQRQVLEKERELSKNQARTLTEVERKISEHKQKVTAREGELAKREEELEASKSELDAMIEQYGDKLTAIKKREDAIKGREEQLATDVEKLQSDRGEFERMRGQLEKEREEIGARSKKLFEKIQSSESKLKELDEREEAVSKVERKLERWEEDLRHTEIHLLNMQEEIGDCVYCSAKDRFILVDKIINDAKALGADVEMAEDEVRTARALLDASEFEKAIERATHAIKLAKQAKRQYYSYGVRYTIKTVEKIITSIKELGVSTEEPETLLKDAKEALQEEDYERAEDYAKMAERIALHMEEKAEDISTGVKRLEHKMVKAEEEERDVSEALIMLDEAKDLAKQGNYGASIERIRKGEEILVRGRVPAGELEPVPAPASPPPGPLVEEEVEGMAPAPEAEVETVTQLEETPAGQYSDSYGQEAYGGGYDQYGSGGQEQQASAPEQEPPSQRFRCPYCQNVFEVRAQTRPVTATCPYCSQKVLIN